MLYCVENQPPSAWLIAHAALTRPMWLNACGKLPSSSPRGRVDLLGQQADVVDEGDGPLERRAGPVDLAGQRQRLGQPERAQQERALLALEAVVRRR